MLLSRKVTQAKNDGVLPPNMTQERLIFTTLPAPGEVFLLQAKVVGRNAADDIEKSTAQSEATRMLPPLMRFLREYIPGSGVWFVLDHAVAANSELQMSGWYLINFAFG